MHVISLLCYNTSWIHGFTYILRMHLHANIKQEKKTNFQIQFSMLYSHLGAVNADKWRLKAAIEPHEHPLSSAPIVPRPVLVDRGLQRAEEGVVKDEVELLLLSVKYAEAVLHVARVTLLRRI